jgi:sugar phosphate isomerase/epimerase
MVTLDDIGWVLWGGTVGLESSLESRAEAAAASGCSRLSLGPVDVTAAAERGIKPAELGRRLRDSGLDLVFDPLMNWHGGQPLPQSRFGRFSAAESLTMCAELKVVSLTAIGNPATQGTIDDIAEAFGSLCDQASDFGANVHLEFIPMSVIKDLTTAWHIVKTADRPNGGILFDTWHFFRGNPDYNQLRGVPGDRIFAVQIDDAYLDVRGSMRDDTQNRLLPGRGDFNLRRVVAELDNIGALSWVGAEVISPETAAMPPTEAATLANQLIRNLIIEVRAPAGAAQAR